MGWHTCSTPPGGRSTRLERINITKLATIQKPANIKSATSCCKQKSAESCHWKSLKRSKIAVELLGFWRTVEECCRRWDWKMSVLATVCKSQLRKRRDELRAPWARPNCTKPAHSAWNIAHKHHHVSSYASHHYICHHISCFKACNEILSKKTSISLLHFRFFFFYNSASLSELVKV